MKCIKCKTDRAIMVADLCLACHEDQCNSDEESRAVEQRLDSLRDALQTMTLRERERITAAYREASSGLSALLLYTRRGISQDFDKQVNAIERICKLFHDELDELGAVL